MPTSCCVYGCKSRRKPGDSSIYFHKFPNEESMKENWLVAIRRTELSIEEIKNKVVCSVHFPKSMYLDRPGTYKPRLKPNAVPSIFNFPETKIAGASMGRRRKREPLAVALKRWGQKRNLEDPSYLPSKAIKREKVSPPREQDGLSDFSTPPPRRSGRPRKILIKRDPGESPPRKMPKPGAMVRGSQARSPKPRKVKKFRDVTELLQSLKMSRLITRETSDILSQHFLDIPLTAFQNNSNGLFNAFEEEIKKFALSLYYTSPKGYRVARRYFKLPHPNAVKNWTLSQNFNAGLLSEVFESLHEALQEKPWISDCVLLVDCMPLNRMSVFDDERDSYCGNVDYGSCIVETEETLASEALTVFLVGLKYTWKCPIAYFLVNKISPVVLTQIIRVCLDKIADTGLRVWSITFDEPSKYSSVIRMLGCNLVTTVENKHKISTSFKHPSREYHIHIVFDYRHMTKLARNVLCEIKSFRCNKQRIEWKYLTRLYDVIERGTEPDTAFHSDTCSWLMHKMNVRLARQIFCSQIADAIDWLRDTAKLPEFQGSQMTTEFIRIMESIYFVLDSRDYEATKRKWQKDNTTESKCWWTPIIHEFIGYLVKLQSSTGKIFIQHQRRQFIVGLIVTGNSLAAMANNINFKFEAPGYFQSYKLSLDSLRVLYTHMRSYAKGNPSALQFKKLLKKYFALSNCLAFENFNTICHSREKVSLKNNYSFVSGFELRLVHKMVRSIENDSMSAHKTTLLHYIAGYISKMLLGKIDCSFCNALLVTNTSFITSLDDFGYALHKPHALSHGVELQGGFIMASDDTVSLVRLTEKYFRLLVPLSRAQLVLKRTTKQKVTAAVLSSFLNKARIPFNSHCSLYEVVGLSEPLHHLQLIKNVIDLYLNLRLQLYWL